MASEIARRCKMGCASWPDDSAYLTCPVCEQPTVRYRGMKPMSVEDAESKRKHAEFDRFYDGEWVQDNTPLTDDELQEIVDLRALPTPDILSVPPARNPARIYKSPRPSPRSGRQASA